MCIFVILWTGAATVVLDVVSKEDPAIAQQIRNSPSFRITENRSWSIVFRRMTPKWMKKVMSDASFQLL